MANGDHNFSAESDNSERFTELNKKHSLLPILRIGGVTLMTNKLLLLTDQQMDRNVLPRNARLRLREFASSERWLLNARPSNPPPICTRVKYAFTHVLPMPNKHFVGRLVIMIHVLLPFDEFPTDTLRSINKTNARK